MGAPRLHERCTTVGPGVQHGGDRGASRHRKRCTSARKRFTTEGPGVDPRDVRDTSRSWTKCTSGPSGVYLVDERDAPLWRTRCIPWPGEMHLSHDRDGPLMRETCISTPPARTPCVNEVHLDGHRTAALAPPTSTSDAQGTPAYAKPERFLRKRATALPCQGMIPGAQGQQGRRAWLAPLGRRASPPPISGKPPIDGIDARLAPKSRVPCASRAGKRRPRRAGLVGKGVRQEASSAMAWPTRRAGLSSHVRALCPDASVASRRGTRPSTVGEAPGVPTGSCIPRKAGPPGPLEAPSRAPHVDDGQPPRNMQEGADRGES
jgi:hypothetical protein